MPLWVLPKIIGLISRFIKDENPALWVSIVAIVPIPDNTKARGLRPLRSFNLKQSSIVFTNSRLK